MKHTDFNREWEFQLGEPSNIPMMKPETKIVSLPYDFMIEGDVKKDAPGGAETGFYQGGKASYTKYFTLTEKELSGQQYMLSFDGCAGAMKLVVNGHTVRRHHYAYTPFHADITPYLTTDRKNRITVTVNDTNEPNSRWYSGAGLYRGVELLTSGKLHIVPEGLFVRTERIEGKTAQLLLDVEAVNASGRTREAGLKVFCRRKGSGEPYLDTGVQSEAAIPAGECVSIKAAFSVPGAALWEIDDPALYELRAVLTERTDAGELSEADEESAVFGIRTITMDAERGLLLNGKELLLKGGCIHHDNGIIGAAAFPDSEYRKVLLHKQNGFNALRFAHNPMSRALLDACDALGMLVIDEAFDVWNMEKDDFDFSQYFREEWEEELTNMLRRDRNHPCIFLWSIGNEIPEQGGLSGGYETSKRLAAHVRALDPTRAVGGALCSFFRGLSDEDNEKYWASIFENAAKLKENGMVNLDCAFGQEVWDPYTAPFVEGWDAVGYNYLRYQYEPTHKAHPDRVMICTESKPREIMPYWEDVKRLPYLIGDFEWTSMDYLGEAGIGDCFYVEEQEVEAVRQRMHMAQYPARTAGAGDFDLCGFEKPQMAYRRIVWGSKETSIVTHDPAHFDKVEILGRYGWGDARHDYTWNAESGSRIRAEVYSGASEVELFLNGASLGKKPAGAAYDYRTVYEFPYEPGNLLAISYDGDGTEISRDELRSAGAAVSLRTEITWPATISGEPDERGVIRLKSDGRSLLYAAILITDAEGRTVSCEEDELTAEVTGNAQLLAFGTGRSSTEENYTRGECRAFEGRALAVVRSGYEEGEAVLIIRSARFGECRVDIRLSGALS